jgi:pimeloyl-ACP methyl ester carboxylesterase
VPAKREVREGSGMGIAEVNGISIGYTVQGQGLPLVMISGMNDTRSSWRRQIGSFKKYFRIITFDNRGAGKSDKPAGPYTTRLMADDTIGLMDYLGIGRAHIVSHSMGGMIAQELAINYPDRVDKVVLGSTFARQDKNSGLSSEVTAMWNAYENSQHTKADLRRAARDIPSLALNNWSNRIFLVPLAKILVSIAPISAETTVGMLAQFEAVLAHDAADRLALIKAPTLVICGSADRTIKAGSSDLIASLVPRAKLVKLAGGSHYVQWEKRSEYDREVLDFLRN